MKINESTTDRILRAIAAVILFVIAWSVGFGSTAGVILTILGFILGITAIVGFCPLYRLFNISTNK